MLTKKDLQKRWKISGRTLDRWMKNRNLPYQKSLCNGRVYFKEEEIKSWEKIMGTIGNQD